MNCFILIMNHLIDHSYNEGRPEMKSITVHGIDELTSRKLTLASEKMGLSLNKTIKRLLQEALGIKPAELSLHRDDFKEFCGIWDNKEYTDFKGETESLRRINARDWE